jgi:uncharacterized protein YlxW (UPF0749 family)
MRMSARFAALALTLTLAALSAAPALAETDSFARKKIEAQEQRIQTLEAQVRALTVLVEEQTARTGELQAKVEANLTLIKALAGALPPAAQPAP